LASVLISAQVLLTPLASSSPVLRHVFFGLPLPCLPVTGNSYKVFKKTLHTPTTDWDILLKDSYWCVLLQGSVEVKERWAARYRG